MPRPRPGSPVGRYLWQTGGLVVGRGTALIALVIIARNLGAEGYGRFVVLLAVLELATAAWKPTVWQGAAARLAGGARHTAWRGTLLKWWAAGAVVIGPIAWWFEGAYAASALVVASLFSAWMTEHIPIHLLAGRQRAIAGATVASQMFRLAGIVAASLAGLLTPSVAIGIIGLGYIVGGILLRTRPKDGHADMDSLIGEVGTEGLIWLETQAPILVIAALLGLDAAGGFDLLYKLSAALVELIAGIGLIIVPNLLDGTAIRRTVATGIRLPTAMAMLLAIGFALTAGPTLDLATGRDLGMGLAPALLAITLVLAPWMGVSKAALLTHGGARWVLASQIATALATVAASTATGLGLVWAATAIASGHFAGAAVRLRGMRSIGALPVGTEVWSLRRLFEDVRRLAALLGRRSQASESTQA